MKNTLLEKAHHLIFYLTGAMNPRMLVTVNGDLELQPITVRVGQAVETVAQPGKPRGITGFQTHTSPVLLHTKERAEIGTCGHTPRCRRLVALTPSLRSLRSRRDGGVQGSEHGAA